LTSLNFRSSLVKSVLHYCARDCWIGDGHGRTEASPAPMVVTHRSGGQAFFAITIAVDARL
jgi:hypothetical protein